MTPEDVRLPVHHFFEIRPRLRTIVVGVAGVATLLLVSAGLWALAFGLANNRQLDRNYAASIAACHRGNVLRLRINALTNAVIKIDPTADLETSPHVDCAKAYQKP